MLIERKQQTRTTPRRLQCCLTMSAFGDNKNSEPSPSISACSGRLPPPPLPPPPPPQSVKVTNINARHAQARRVVREHRGVVWSIFPLVFAHACPDAASETALDELILARVPRENATYRDQFDTIEAAIAYVLPSRGITTHDVAMCL